MSTANVLVAAPIDTATPFSGSGLLDSGSQLVAAVDSGSWVEGGLAGVGFAIDVAATAIDPLGSLIGAGVGWIIDHLEPLKGWLNDFAGNAGEVAAFAQTWSNIQTQLETSAQELAHVVGQVDEMAGEAMEAYRRFQQDVVKHLSGAASWAGAMSTGLQMASTIVQVVHDLVRDVLSQLAGAIISWVAELVVTVGLATPVVIGQVTTRVSQLATTVGETVTKVLRSCKNLGRLLDDLKGLLQRAGDLFSSVLKGGASGPSVRVPNGPTIHARVGEPLSPADLKSMIDEGYHTSIFSDKVVQHYDHSAATLGRSGSDVWAMPTEDAAKIHTPAQAARETGMAPMAQDAYLNGGDIYAVHFPVDPGELRRPTVADSGGWEHFYPDPTNTSTTYGHTAVNTGTGAYLVNSTRETLIAGGDAMRSNAVLTKLENGAWVLVRRY